MPVKRGGKLNGIKAKLENGQKRAGIESGMVVAQKATQKAPRNHGRLKRSITHGTPEVVGPMKVVTTVGTNVEYARAQEEGMTIDIPEIAPKTKKALAFPWPAGPSHLKKKGTDIVILKKVKAHKVTIPAHPYLRPALEESRQLIKAIHVRNLVAALRS